MGYKLTILSAAVFAVPMLTACGSKEADSPSDYEAKVHTFMLEELDEAVDGIWEHGGWVITEAGEESLFPDTDQGWEDVAASAERVKSLALELTKEEYSQGQEYWINLSNGLADAADIAKEAAIAKDEQAVFDAGGVIYNICKSCHERYELENAE